MLESSSTQLPGKVYLVGAGPGDPGLLTLRAQQCLAQADVVLYDYLVNVRILRHAPPNAELVCSGGHGRHNKWPQPKINQRMIDEALAGKCVVRLKSGDPIIFGRAAEEFDALIANQIPFEVVPGITAALAAGSYAGLPLTHRDSASSVAFVTGHQQANNPTPLDYQALAQFPGTLVFYMGVTTAKTWSSELIRHGLPADTSVALVRRCSWPDQQTIRCRLDEVAERVTPYQKFPPPAIAVVGPIADMGESLNWFQNRPLFGQTILVTRPEHQADSLADELEAAGAEVLLQPAIRIDPPDDWSKVDQAIQQLEIYDWIVFSSANGVRSFLDRLWQSGRDIRQLQHVQLAAIGPATAAALEAFHLRADLVPNKFEAETLAKQLATDNHTAQSFLLIRASRGREVLAETLAANGHWVTQVVVYRSTDIEAPDTEILERLRTDSIDWVTVTSSAIAKSLVHMFGSELKRTKLASISPITSATLRELGYPPHAEAIEYTMPGVIDAIRNT